MVVGFDVTHPSTGQTLGGAPSVAAMVASTDGFLSQWLAEISIQQQRQERVSDLKHMLKTRLQVWKARHGSYPMRVLVYRDGVSESQYAMVKDQELPLLKEACTELYGAASQEEPDMTVVIVAKRHHTRFAPLCAENADRAFNCHAGTVVDRAITSPFLWQFFLQSHSTLKGTARAGFYTVISDEIFRKWARTRQLTAADLCEDVTQALCYTFGRATRAVGIVTPAYYADIVCTRAACYLNAIDMNAIAASVCPGGPSQTNDPDDDSKVAEYLAKLQKEVTTHEKLKDTMFFI